MSFLLISTISSSCEVIGANILLPALHPTNYTPILKIYVYISFSIYVFISLYNEYNFSATSFGIELCWQLYTVNVAYVVNVYNRYAPVIFWLVLNEYLIPMRFNIVVTLRLH